MLIAVSRLFGQCFLHDLGNSFRHHRVQLANRRRRLMEVLINSHPGSVGGERQPAGQHLVDNYPEGINVAAGIYCSASRLLRRHIIRSADESCHPGQVSGLEEFGQP